MVAGRISEALSDTLAVLLAEIEAGDGLSFSAAGRLFPAHRGTGTTDPSTVWRWARKGSKRADGTVVRLEVAKVGGRWLTSRGAVRRFVAALSQAHAPEQPRTPAQASRAAEQAAKQLAAMGA